MKRAVLTAAVVAPAMGASTAAAKTAGLAGTAAGKLVLAVTVATAVAGGGWVAMRPAAAVAPPVVQSARAPIARSLAPMTRSAEVSGDLAALEVEVPPAPKRPRPPARPLAPMASSAEVLEVKQALAEVSRDRFEAALARVRALSARFPQSLLATEAQTVEVLALCGLQRRDEAEALAQALRRRDPLNPSLRRLDASCVGQRK